ncbi:HAD hydrolase-like protein [Clostridium sp. AM58-1XD]|uniref:HAD family hydrolase n=1 Tax=Clostridium sp. AM58-1XD TaxID=2292307 RepID=UPI001FA86ED5|nr:HAD hydrolase-like protein [Clostridium sp. AM58-1XD]
MDTMDIKHKRCFGPQMVKSWGLEANEKEVLDIWNKISLYSETRGINRFPGLGLTLNECSERGIVTEDFRDLMKWLESTAGYSSGALKKALEEWDSPVLRRVLEWSDHVNKAIAELPESLPFEGVKETLEYMREYADLAVVSSANREAVEKEWTRHGMIGLVKEVLAQDSGSKTACIARLLEEGYDKDHVIMIGDAPGDGSAADRNGVLFYPMVIRREAECWRRLREEAFGHFLNGTYKGAYQEELLKEFHDALK